MKTSISYILIFILLTGIGSGIVWHKLKHIEVPHVQFSITLSGENEDFLVLYYRTKNEVYTIEKRIKQTIAGDSVFRTFDYQLPAGATHVRIDFSQNVNETNLIIKNIALKDANGSSKIIEDEQLRSLRFNHYCHNFELSEKGLQFNARTIGKRSIPRIEDMNLPYLLYYSR